MQAASTTLSQLPYLTCLHRFGEGMLLATGQELFVRRFATPPAPDCIPPAAAYTPQLMSAWQRDWFNRAANTRAKQSRRNQVQQYSVVTVAVAVDLRGAECWRVATTTDTWLHPTTARGCAYGILQRHQNGIA
eukprot:COSAG05_NODE_2519_length_2950_cov_72.884602_1_plen_133_part_00